MQTVGIRKKSGVRQKVAKATHQSTSAPIADALRIGAVRAKLRLGGAADPQESEADRVADQIVAMTTPAPRAHSPQGSPIRRTLAPAAEEEQAQALRRQRGVTDSEQEDPVQTLRLAESESPDEEKARALRCTESACPEEESVQSLRRQADPASEDEHIETLRRAEAATTDEALDGNDFQQQVEQGAASESNEGDDAKPLEEPSNDEMKALNEQINAQPATIAAYSGEVPLATAARIRRPGPGRPLDPEARAFMEPRFRAEFSVVRVHDETRDREIASKLGARAFAHGTHIWLGPNERMSDRRLMAHELTHVVQSKPGLLRNSVGPVQTTRAPQAQPSVRRILGWLPDWAKEKLAGWAAHVPGYTLLTFILGQNPITGEAVERSAINFVGAIMGLIPGGTKLFQLLKDSGALQNFFTWVSTEFGKLNLSLDLFISLIRKAWDGVSVVYSLARNIQIIKDVFAPTLSRVWRFLKTLGSKVLEFVFEGVMAIAGPLATRIIGILKKAGSVISQIISDPVDFIGNLVRALVKGFNQFKDRIFEHLKQGIFAWLFGALSGAGLTLPQKFDLKGIVSIVLQVLGLTYQRIRKKLVKVMGERRVAMFEKTIELLRILVTEGVMGIWRKLVEYIGSLQELVIGKIRDWVVTKIVTAAVTKLVSMFNPAGAIIQAITTIYNTILFFIERMKQIAALVESVFDSIGAIASGRLTAAANFVEQAMGRTIPVFIGFLARLIGLGGISAKIKDIIKSIQSKVNKAIDKVTAIIVKMGKALWGKAKTAAAAAARRLLGVRPIPLGPDGENHTLKVNTTGETATPEIHSFPQAISEFLRGAKNDDTIGQRRKDKYLPTAEAALAELMTALQAYNAAKRKLSGPAASRPTSAELEAVKSAADSANSKLAREIRLLIKDRSKNISGGAAEADMEQKRQVLLSRYRLEGTTAIYSNAITETGDEFSPDHQPQNAVLAFAANLDEFKYKEYGARKQTLVKAAKGHSRGAETISLHNNRHKAGRTFSSKGTATSQAFRDTVSASRDAIINSGQPNDTPTQRGQKVRTMVIQALRGELGEDVNVMKGVVKKAHTDPVWGDIHQHFPKPPNATDEEKQEIDAHRRLIVSAIRGQVRAGEDRIAAQPLERYAE